ncbi:hypothetical protein J4730_23730 [Klebsiella pneumoniae]|uniref:Carboxylase conserved domain-containing protein n=1 Tax=Klebsiella pneumoniae TaxID=573 RepID=A0A939NJ11_KLEPN|nr:hypothetical protein [Klebsiella pneumoniae]
MTPTSQIVGTRAVLNVLTGERYKTIAKETAGILKGEYGRTPAPVNAALQARVLDGADPVTCRPADLLKPELAQLEADVKRRAGEGHHACRKRHRRRAHRGAVPAARPEVPRKPPQPGGL